MNWGEGYNVDLPYTYGYYRELDPRWLDFGALIRGVLPPSKIYEKERLRYIEFGCGQGYCLCLVAACNPQMEFVGIDFNPQHIAHAKRLKKIAGLENLEFYEANFVTLGESWPAELGHFHYAVSHGVLSWINRRVREGLYKCLEYSLVPGGLIYLSYNTLPGWLSSAPVQHLLRFWQKKEALTSLEALKTGRKKLNDLLTLKATMINVLPAIKITIERVQKLDESYLSGEYLNDNWSPFWFDEIWDELTPHKFSYVGSASSVDWVINTIMPKEWWSYCTSIQDPVERELTIDVLINQSFRRDIWVKGKTPVWIEEQKKLLDEVRFSILKCPIKDIENILPDLKGNPLKEEYIPKFNTNFGEIKGRPDIYIPLYAELIKGEKTIKDLLMTLYNFHRKDDSTEKPHNYLSIVIESLAFMLNDNHIFFSSEKDTKLINNFNETILNQASLGAPYRFLIASRFPAVIGCNLEDMLSLIIYRKNPTINSVSLSQQLLTELTKLGVVIRDKNGNPLTDEEDKRKRVMEAVINFLTNVLPYWKEWGII